LKSIRYPLPALLGAFTKALLYPLLFAALIAASALTSTADAKYPQPSPELVAVRAAAQAGDRNAQLDLSLRYLHGNGVVESPKMAAKWASGLAEEGNRWGCGRWRCGCDVRMRTAIQKRR
jgi:TPR repeat protein